MLLFTVSIGSFIKQTSILSNFVLSEVQIELVYYDTVVLFKD